MDIEIHDHAPERKAGITFDERMAYDDLARTFETFKATNDERLAELKRGDVLLEEKVARINDALDSKLKRIEDLSLRDRRPQLDGARRALRESASHEHKSAFDAYVRGGETTALRALETKALSVGSNPDGGYLVPVELEQEIGVRLRTISPIRSIASVREISGNVYKKPFMTAGPAAGWVGETDARTQTTSPTLDALSFPAMELYAMPAATASLLEDTAVNIDEWIASEVELTFATQEGTAFVTGDGVNKPKGFLNYTAVANSSWSWGNLGYVASGAAGAFASSNASDALVDLVYALKAGYRQNGVFVMNRKTQAAVRKLKDAGGSYLWQPPEQAGGRARGADDLPAGRGRGHAGYRREFIVDRVRRFPARLSDRRPAGRASAARSLLGQALCAVLHDQARRRRRAGL